MTHSDPDNPETTFSLEQVFTANAAPSLVMPQSDTTKIVLALQKIMNGEARSLQREAAGVLRPRTE